MAAELLAGAGWALWSKQARARSDYSVIACSREPFDAAAFNEIITRFAVGTPDPTAGGPGALPWVTVSWVGVDAMLHLGIAVTDRTDQVDGMGRPITQTSYYCVPYAPLAAAAEKRKAPVSYAALLKAVLEHPLPAPGDGAPVPLRIEPASADQMASVVRKFGEQAVISTAALLLSGPVGIIGADGATLRERLDFIDAVASLLPHGYRTKLSAATWSQGGSRHRVRLAFGAYPRDDGATVTWRRGAEPAALRDAARVYFDQAWRLAGAGSVPLPAVIGHLAADAAPRRFEQPQDAVDSLSQLDQPFRVLRAIRDRTGANLADLRQVLRMGRARELPGEGDRAELLAELASQGDAQDWQQLRQDAAKLRSTDDLVRVLSAFGRRMLWTATPPEAAASRDCLRLAAESGVADPVLAALIRPPDGAAEPAARLEAAAGLLADTVLPARRDHPRTREALASDPVVAAEYTGALSRAGQAAAFLRWFDPQAASAFSRAFRAVLGVDDGWVSEDALAEFGPGAPGCARVLLQVGSQAGSLDKVLPGFTSWLAAQGALDDEQRRYWAGQLAGLAPRGPRAQAYLDTALLMAGAPPSALPPGQPDPAVDYGSTVAGIWAGLSRTYSSFDAEGCARALAGCLARQPWAASAEQALGVCELVKRLHDFDPERRLAKIVASTLATTPQSRGWDFAQEWVAWGAANEPEAMRRRLLDSLAAPPGSDPAALARLCVNACREGIDPGAALAQLGRSGALTSAAQAYQLCDELQLRFAEGGLPDDEAAAWQLRLIELAAAGTFGTRFLPELRAMFSADARRQLRFYVRVLAAFAEDGKDRQHEWSDAEHKELSAVADDIESMLKRARRSPLAKLRRQPSGGGHEEDTPGQGGGPPPLPGTAPAQGPPD